MFHPVQLTEVPALTIYLKALHPVSLSRLIALVTMLQRTLILRTPSREVPRLQRLHRVQLPERYPPGRNLVLLSRDTHVQHRLALSLPSALNLAQRHPRHPRLVSLVFPRCMVPVLLRHPMPSRHSVLGLQVTTHAAHMPKATPMRRT